MIKTNLENYIRFRLQKRKKFTSLQESKDLLEDIYKEMEAHGYKHTDIYVVINNVIINNIKKLVSKHKKQKEE